MNTGFVNLRKDMDERFAEFHLEISANNEKLLKQMHQISNSHLRWVIGTLIGLFIAFVGVILAMNNTFKVPLSQPTSAEPTASAQVVLPVPVTSSSEASRRLHSSTHARTFRT
jgi:hypothetical protein